MKFFKRFFPILILGFTFQFTIAQTNQPNIFQWEQLPELPNPLAGQFVGTHNNALIVAGGSYFPTSLFEGGHKVWLDNIFVLESGSNHWNTNFHLDHPRAYGGAISTDDSIILIGGSDGKQHFASVFKLKWENGIIQKQTLPDLPAPNAYFATANLANIIYVAGGQAEPSSTEALKVFWALDLSNPETGWQELEPWPGPARILPVAAAQSGSFYLFSGAELYQDSTGKTTRTYLTDGYQFTPERGWKQIASSPRPMVAAPGIEFGPSHIFIFGGDDGSIFKQAFELKDNYPGFVRDIYAYHTITDEWSVIGEIPEAYVTTNATYFENRIVIAGGEDRPGHRGTKVLSGLPQKQASAFSRIDYFIILLYFILLIIMGWHFARREKSTDDFFIASQRIPWWAAGISIFGTQLSAITFLAAPAKSYAEDWVYFLVNMTIILIAPFVVYLYLPFFRKIKITSAYEYLEQRFNLAVRLFGSIAFLLFQIGRMGIVLFLPAIVLSTATGINVYACIIVMGVLATIYTAMGGIEAVIWTDVTQVFVLAGGALVSLIIIAANVDGGFSGIVSEGLVHGKFYMFDLTWNGVMEMLWIVVIGNIFATAIPYTSDQTVIQRYLTTPTEKQAAKAIWTNAALSFPISILFFGLGTALFVFYKSQPALLDPTLQTDAIFPLFIVHQLPAGVAGLVVAGIFAASMSSLDSSLNSMAAVVITDFYLRLKKNTVKINSLNLARWLTILFGAVGTVTAILLATFNIESLLDAFREILGLFGGSLAGLFALGIFSKRATGAGALTGAVSSAIILWLVKSYTDIHFFLYALIGIVSCYVIGYVASLFTKRTQKDISILTFKWGKK